MILCQELIWLDKRRSTYCMREKGHAGKHNIVNREPDPEPAQAPLAVGASGEAKLEKPE